MLDFIQRCRRAAPLNTFALILISLLTFATQVEAKPTRLLLGGTGGDLGTMRLLAKAYEKSHPDVTVQVVPSLGSGGGIKALLAGAIDLSISSRPVKDKEYAQGARSRPYAKTALVFAVPKNMPNKGITTPKVLEIFTGDRAMWADGSPVRLVLRPPTDGDFRILAKHINGMGEALKRASKRKHLPVGVTDQHNAEILEKLKCGFGVTSLSLILAEKRSLRALALDGIVPSPETIASGAYPIGKTFHLVTGPAVTTLASDFIAFIGSPEGSRILRRSGHVEVSQQAAQK